MPIILTVNAGSSSLRLAAYRSKGSARHCVAEASPDPDSDAPAALLQQFLRDQNLEADCVVHRVVHGGDELVQPCRIDDQVEASIAALQPLAPLHNPAALQLIKAGRELPGTPVQWAVFDTAFFHDLPNLARTVALPAELSRRYKLRRYGFHGLAHQSMWQTWHSRQPEGREPARIISLQLGSGCSIAAVRDGRPLDTSMGFTPLEGLVMATRVGDLDPGLLLYMQRELGMDVTELEDMLNNHSGLRGLSGLSDDMRVLLESTSELAREAVELYCYRAAKYIGGYLTVLDSADAIVFGGGVGENAPLIRARILERLQWAGIQLDSVANAAHSSEPRCISDAASTVAVWVVPVDEATVMLDQVESLMATD